MNQNTDRNVGSSPITAAYTAHTTTELYRNDVLVACRAEDGKWYPNFGGNLTERNVATLVALGNRDVKPVDGAELAYRMNRAI